MTTMNAGIDAAQQMMSTTREGVKTWFKFANLMMEEADKHGAESLKAFGPVHEQLVAARKNAMKLAEENVERGAQLTEQMLQAWKVK